MKNHADDDDSIEIKRVEKRRGLKLTILKRAGGEKVYPKIDKTEEEKHEEMVVQDLEVNKNE